MLAHRHSLGRDALGAGQRLRLGLDAEQLVVDRFDRARVPHRVEALARVLGAALAEARAQLGVVDQQPQRGGDRAPGAASSSSKPVLPGSSTPAPSREPDATTGLPYIAASSTGPPEPDALVRERDDVERAVDLAGLRGERQEREVRVEPLLRARAP